MRKAYKNIFRLSIIALTLQLSILSCGKETQNTTQGGGVFKITAKISPPLQIGVVNGGMNAFSLGINGSTAQWIGNSASSNLSEITTDELSVTSGQNITSIIYLSNAYDQVCRTVTLEGIQNGKVIKTYNLELGIKDAAKALYCKDGYQITKNFIAE
jgi:hypothetical protein